MLFVKTNDIDIATHWMPTGNKQADDVTINRPYKLLYDDSMGHYIINDFASESHSLYTQEGDLLIQIKKEVKNK